MKSTNLTYHLKFSILLILFSSIVSCKKNNKLDVPLTTKNNLTEFGIYTVGFQDASGNQGLSVIVVLETPNRTFSIENFSFQYNEKDGEKIRLLSNVFFQNIANKDSSLSKYNKLSDYITAFFKNANSYQKSVFLSNEQLLALIQNKPFLIAKNGEKDKSIMYKILGGLIPNANAQTTPQGVYKNLYGVLAGGMLIAVSSILDLPLIAIVGIGVAGNYLIDQATGNEFNSSALLTGDLGDFAYLLFGSGQLTNFLNSLLDPAKKVLDPTYVPTKSPETPKDILDNIQKYLNDYITKLKSTVRMSVISEDATSITTTSAVVAGSFSSDKPVAGIIYNGVIWSKTSEPIYGGNYASAGAGIGHFSTIISGLTRNTTYYYRAYAYYVYGPKLDKSYVWGAVKSFKTKNELKIGDDYAGGTIFYLDNSKMHGLVASACGFGAWDPTYYPPNQGYTPLPTSTSTSFGSGKANTLNIASVFGPTSAAGVCLACEVGGYKDWYLPSLEELTLYYKNLSAINKISSIDVENWTSSAFDQYNTYVIETPSGKTQYIAACCGVIAVDIAIRNF
ncbi:hypothetical protein KXD93_25530 [Mucilaginibacter sp. BJC16-A38]|uniref:hypothetical protein n=1 Tax=Mucilaginibacter phenanthrenivorans TaxID=1234842 RepID=UPI002156FFA9|nr:hypothetical protein [Mucilaginibacter phenanthrenivorans]MCR8561044.1 hypothetical protein [Mucilaginibacter phenanthrenivorans]